MTVNESRQVDLPDSRESIGSGGETEDWGLSHARLGVEGNMVNEIAATGVLVRVASCQKQGQKQERERREIASEKLDSRGHRRKRQAAEPTSRAR
jgi:hypothetical protein